MQQLKELQDEMTDNVPCFVYKPNFSCVFFVNHLNNAIYIYMELQVSKMKIVKAQAKAVLSEMKRQSTASQSSTG